MVDKALIRAEELGLDPTEENLNTLVPGPIRRLCGDITN